MMLRAIAVFAASLALAGCGTGGKLQPPAGPDNAPPPPAPPPAHPPQVQIEPEKKLVPLPTATKRILVFATERTGQAETPRRDPESESILAEALLAASGDLGIEVVKKGVFEEILARDFDSLVQKGLQENAAIFSNLLQSGVDYLAIGAVGSSEITRDTGQGRTAPDRYSIHAGVELVKTDDAQVLGAGNADAESRAYREAKTKALGEAARALVEALRTRPKGGGPLQVTITVDGLSQFSQADKISKKLREIDGVLWSRDLRFSSGSPGKSSGVARFELAWAGTPEDLRARIEGMNAGLKLEATKIEGARWNYRVIPETPPPAPGTGGASSGGPSAPGAGGAAPPPAPADGGAIAPPPAPGTPAPAAPPPAPPPAPGSAAEGASGSEKK